MRRAGLSYTGHGWPGIKAFLTVVLQTYGELPFDSHEDTMLDPESDVAEQLAGAIRHHQKNLADKDKAEKNVEMLRQMVTQLEAMSPKSGEDE